MKIAIGCDEAAFEMKVAIKKLLESEGYVVVDFGTNEGETGLYPDIGVAVAECIVRGEAQRGLLFCGTGIGMAISANKVPTIRAAQAHDTYSAERASKSNDAQIITIGARVVGIELAKSIVQAYLKSNFETKSASKLEALANHEARLRKL